MGYNCNHNIDIKMRLSMDTNEDYLQLLDNEALKLKELKYEFLNLRLIRIHFKIPSFRSNQFIMRSTLYNMPCFNN